MDRIQKINVSQVTLIVMAELTMAMYASFRTQNFETVIGKSKYGFIQRLHKSTNSLIMSIEKNMDFWQKNIIHYSRNIKSSQLMSNGIVII